MALFCVKCLDDIQLKFYKKRLRILTQESLANFRILVAKLKASSYAKTFRYKNTHLWRYRVHRLKPVWSFSAYTYDFPCVLVVRFVAWSIIPFLQTQRSWIQTFDAHDLRTLFIKTPWMHKKSLKWNHFWVYLRCWFKLTRLGFVFLRRRTCTTCRRTAWHIRSHASG